MQKLKLIIGLLAVILIASSCDKYDNTLLVKDIYQQVYMPRAENGDITSPVTQKDSTIRLLYSAYLGGAAPAKKDVTVSFGIEQTLVDQYNAAHQTNYKLLPEANYTLTSSSATILSGQRSTDSMVLDIKTNTSLDLFETYILPLSITQVTGQGTINQALQTCYYIFSVGFAQGEVPSEKVLSLGDTWGGIFCAGPKQSVLSNNKDNFDIYLHLPNEEGIYDKAALDIGYNYNASESFYYFNDSSMVVRNFPFWAGLFNFNINYWNVNQSNPDPASDIIYGAANFWLGDHWDAYKIAPFNNYVMTIDNGGNLYRQPAYSFIEVSKTQVGSGYTDIKQALEFPGQLANSLLALDGSGKLWYIPMNTDGVPGAKKQVGSGWNKYLQIIVIGSDILGIDASHDVYRYHFDPRGFYPL